MYYDSFIYLFVDVQNLCFFYMYLEQCQDQFQDCFVFGVLFVFLENYVVKVNVNKFCNYNSFSIFEK